MEKEESLDQKAKTEDHSEETDKVEDLNKEDQTKTNDEVEEKEISPEDKIRIRR